MADGILVKLGLDGSSFKRGLRQVQQEAGKLGEGMKGALGQLGGAGTLAGVGGIAALGVAVGQAVRKIGELSDASANVGLTVEEYQKLGFAFRDVGLSAEDMDKTVATMNSKIGEAAQGNEAANQSLNKLGLTYDGIKNMSPAQQFETIAKAISKLPTQAERAAAATDLFGKSGKKLDQLIMGFDGVMAKAEEAGNLIGQDTADAADKLGDELSKLGDAFTALVANSGFIDFLSSAVKSMVEMQNTIKGGTAALLEMEGKLKDIGAQDLSGGAYSGSLWENLKDAWLGEKEGAKVTTGKATKAEVQDFKKKQDEKVKLAKEAEEKEAKMREDAKKKLNEKERKKDSEDTDKLLKDADAAIKKSQDARQDMVQKNAEEEDKKNAENIKTLDDMEKEVELQKMVNDGKAREAAIQEAISKAQEAGMSDVMANAMGDLAGQKFDLTNAPKAQYMAEHSDALLRIGGSMGNNPTQNSTATFQTKSINLLEKLNNAITQQTAKWETFIRTED